MLPSERIELAIYRYVNVQGTERSTQVTALAATVDSTIPLVIERLKGLHLAGHIKLSKYIVAVDQAEVEQVVQRVRKDRLKHPFHRMPLSLETEQAVQRYYEERGGHPFCRIPYSEEGNILIGPEDFFTQRDFIIEITPEGRRVV